MSLIIKGVDMPYCCVVCPFKEMYNDGLLCKATKPHQYIPKFLHKRDEKCPLTEFPTPHGRLVDSNELLDDFMKAYPVGSPELGCAFEIIENAETFIKAEA